VTAELINNFFLPLVLVSKLIAILKSFINSLKLILESGSAPRSSSPIYSKFIKSFFLN